MKKFLLISAALMLAQAAFSQGQISFDNRANAAGTYGTFPGVVVAPIYGVDPANRSQRVSGNTSAGVPMGSATYGGPLLAGSGFTATLWARNSTAVTGDATANNLALVGTTTMRTNTTGTSAGRLAASAANPVVPDVAPGTTDRGTFQVRVWDSQGGSILTWDQALQTPNEAYGYSDLFTVPYALTTGINTPPNLEGMRSFNLTVVPEPSVIALGVLGAGCLFMLRRRK
jgi:hypothetical protein